MITQSACTPSPPQRIEYSAWRREPLVLAGVLDAVSAVNEQLLEGLSESARGASDEFPLPQSLRLKIATLTVEELRKVARCGVYLADANLIDFACWREAALTGESTALPAAFRAWLPVERSSSLAHSALLVAWHLTQTNPAVARVLLGMSAPGVAAYRALGISDLAHIARHHSDWVRPRWSQRLDVWSDLIDSVIRPGAQGPRTMTLRCLQVSAGDLKWLSAYAEPFP